jgi:hypothetical protein
MAFAAQQRHLRESRRRQIGVDLSGVQAVDVQIEIGRTSLFLRHRDFPNDSCHAPDFQLHLISLCSLRLCAKNLARKGAKIAKNPDQNFQF